MANCYSYTWWLCVLLTFLVLCHHHLHELASFRCCSWIIRPSRSSYSLFFQSSREALSSKRLCKMTGLPGLMVYIVSQISVLLDKKHGISYFFWRLLPYFYIINITEEKIENYVGQIYEFWPSRSPNGKPALRRFNSNRKNVCRPFAKKKNSFRQWQMRNDMVVRHTRGLFLMCQIIPLQTKSYGAVVGWAIAILKSKATCNVL